MHSVRRRGLGAATLVLAAAGLLAGCTSTQHAAKRMQLDSARERAAQLSTRVTSANPLITATRVATVSGGGATAFVVTVHNGSRRAATDLPISVGYSLPGGRRVYLNAGTTLNYFEAHLPAIFSGRSSVWVYTANAELPRGARPFAFVGSKPAAPALLTETNVRIRLTWTEVRAGTVRIKLVNPTSVPQYQLQVYAYAERSGHYTAAANATVVDLGAGSKQSLTLHLVGEPDGARLQIEAIPTILQ